ncbi:hypothetical protein [Pannonibacter sp.]|uniref:hypothetical protein n=1 Tax=Pannonibacter sp. TaxID=1906786 RepID=UPI003F6E5D42
MTGMTISLDTGQGRERDETLAEILADPSIRLALGTGAALVSALAAVHACCLLPSMESWHGLAALCSSAV